MPGTWSSNIPTLGETRGSEELDTSNALSKLFEAVNSTLTSGNELDGAKVAASTIPTTALKSDASGLFIPVMRVTNLTTSELAAGTYIFGNNSLVKNEEAFGSTNAPAQYLNRSEDLSISNKTLKFKLRAFCFVNEFKPTVKFTFGVYTMVPSGENALKLTLASLVTGSTVEINEPPSVALTNGASSEFTLTNGISYVIGVVTSAKLTAKSTVNLGAQLYAHNA